MVYSLNLNGYGTIVDTPVEFYGRVVGQRTEEQNVAK